MHDNINTIKKLVESVHCVKSVEDVVSAVLKKLVFCPFCSECFTDTPSLTDHIKKDHPERLKSREITVENHEVNEGSEIIYICPHCHFAVDNYDPSPTSAIVDHIGEHTASIDPTARISFQISRDKKLIQKYVKDNVKNELFSCSFCTDIFGDRESLLRHIAFKHSDVDPENVPFEIMKIIMEYAKDFSTGKKAKSKNKTKYSF